MENWDPQMMLDLYLHNYLTKKNMHTTAEIFAREANFYPKGVAIEHPEGFLSEWWSIFWSMFSNKFPEHTVQDNGSGPSNSNPAMPSPNFNYMLQNMCPTMPPGFPNVAGPSIMQMQQIKNLFESDYSRMMMPRPDNGNSLGSDFLGMMMPRPENGNLLECDLTRMMMPRPVNRNLLGSDFSRAMMLSPETGNLLESDFSRTMMSRPENGNSLGGDSSRTMTMPMPEKGNFLGSDFPRMIMPRLENENFLGSEFSRMMMPRPENGNFPRSDIPTMNSNSPFMNVDQLARMLPSSSNPSYQREKVFKNPQLCLTRDDKCGSSFRRPTAAGPSKPSTKPHELKFKSPETDTRSPAKNLNFNSQLNDPLVRLVPSSINFSPPPQEKVHKKPHQLCLKTDDKSSTRFCSSAAEETARFLPKASPGKMEHAAGTDARRVCEPERFALLSVDRSTQMLPSGSNFSGPKKNKKQRQLAAIGCKRYGADTRAFVQAHIGPPPGMELDSNSQPNDIDQLPLLLSSPSKHSPQQNVSKNGKLPVTQDDGCDTNLKSSTDSEPTHPAPEATIPPKTELAETG
ncbi:transcriptional corepressor leunig [Phtheirospermum japonicum]|uniref:Transcriptional corepressor leunig n=1 Tax=Phtheirospermum japonicum TaxID=374723 RepID=A0A830BUM0_9LAMI|nr:transcriptional corepressor leunig [Phtheirospermum japonicum]